ncbi:MAG: S1 RNA-binding domain-containing protein, partial [Oscillospiraceae bacterium]|nr:S1 RNA-binding domain-containing protein [Oscillospiraceae bacterium]
MALEVGEVFEGKVTGITKFGAFVAMPDGKNGLVHISEIANTYVNDINEFVKERQVVKVRVIGIGDGGKVNLSIKR